MYLQNVDEIAQEEYRAVVLQYCTKMFEIFQSRLLRILLFGSLAKNRAKPLRSAESDFDLLMIVRSLPPLKRRILMLADMTRQHRLTSLIQAICMTPHELEEHVEAKSGWMMEALYEGIVLYDPDKTIDQTKRRLIQELEDKGARRTDIGWIWPVKAGETIQL